MHDESVAKYVKEAEQKAAKKAAEDKIKMDAEIAQKAAEKAETLTAAQVDEYIKKAKKEADEKAAQDEIDNEKAIKVAAEAKAMEYLEEFKQAKRAILDLGSTISVSTPYTKAYNADNAELYNSHGYSDESAGLRPNFWRETSFPGDDSKLYYVNKLSM